MERYYLDCRQLNFHKRALDFLWRLQKEIQSKDFKTAFTWNQGLHEMIFSYQQFDQAFLEDDKKKLFEEFKNINSSLVQPSLTPSHRDFHSRNLFICKDQVYIIDFQDAGFYPAYYDAVSLIEDPYAGLSDQEKQELMDYYQEKWNQEINKRLFQLTTVQRLFKAAGSFMSFFHLRGQSGHLKYVRPALKRVEWMLIQMDEHPYFLKYIQLILNHKTLSSCS